MSTYGSTLDFVKKKFGYVHESEYFPDAAPGEVIDGVVNQDVQNLSFKDESLDLIRSACKKSLTLKHKNNVLFFNN
jgi:hypothetical protein